MAVDLKAKASAPTEEATAERQTETLAVPAGAPSKKSASSDVSSDAASDSDDSASDSDASDDSDSDDSDSDASRSSTSSSSSDSDSKRDDKSAKDEGEAVAMAIRIAEEDAAVKRANVAKKAEAAAARARRAEAANEAAKKPARKPERNPRGKPQKPQQQRPGGSTLNRGEEARTTPELPEPRVAAASPAAHAAPNDKSGGAKKYTHLATSPGNLKMLLKAATAKRRTKNANATSGLSTPASAAATPAGVSPAPAARAEETAPAEPPKPAATRPKPGGPAASGPTRSVGSADTTNTRRSTRSASAKRAEPAARPEPAAEPRLRPADAATPIVVANPVEIGPSSVPNGAPDMIPVTCGTKAGQYILSEKRILFEGRKIAPAKFEELAALKTKRWKRNIKVVGEVSDRAVNIGEMLDILGIDTAAGVEQPKHKPRARTPAKE